MGTKKKLDNIIWHIETNREVLSDERTLDDALKSLKNWSKELINESVLKVEESKTYKGWEILKMINEGELKDGDKYIRNDSAIFEIGAGLQPNTKSWAKDTFTIPEKEYMTFEEAIKHKKIFKYKDWECYRGVANAMSKLGTTYTNEEIEEMINEKAWEVEEC
ncbi:MAG: hypothetical protein K0S61_4782 [Anaerocolumna sp.]|jgi:hypothetical protein|nr:hypothetical protein [Anaerocolumna sp.]